MSTDAWILEKAAFACFSGVTEDSFKRLLFLHISKVVKENQNITTNRAFGIVSDRIVVNRPDFEAAVRALETPFKRLKINKYKRRSVSASDVNQTSNNTRQVVHLNVVEDCAPWNVWVKAVTEKYPELSIWVDE